MTIWSTITVTVGSEGERGEGDTECDARLNWLESNFPHCDSILRLLVNAIPQVPPDIALSIEVSCETENARLEIDKRVINRT